MLIDDLAEVINRVTSIARTTVREAEAPGRIARIRNVGPITVRNIQAPVANRIQRQEDIASR